MSTDREVRASHAVLAADACLLTAASFSAFTMIALLVLAMVGSLGQPGIAEQLVSVVLMIAGGVIGPVAAWRLHGRVIDRWTVLGGLLGVVAGGVATVMLALLASGARALSSGIAGNEFAGLIALGAIIGIGFVALLVSLDFDAVRDLAPARRTHTPIDVARIGATVALLAMAGVIAVIAAANPSSGIGDAGVFALAAGITGAAIVMGADAVTTFHERGRRGEPVAPAGA